MSRARLTIDTMEPAMITLLTYLVLDTTLDERAYRMWRHQYQTVLLHQFERQGLDDITYFDVWARERFLLHEMIA